jgi:hypothetical protein
VNATNRENVRMALNLTLSRPLSLALTRRCAFFSPDGRERALSLALTGPAAAGSFSPSGREEKKDRQLPSSEPDEVSRWKRFLLRSEEGDDEDSCEINRAADFILKLLLIGKNRLNWTAK